MLSTIAGQCGVITPATDAIGRAVVLELAREGARVGIGYHGYRGPDFERAEGLISEVNSAGGEALLVRVPKSSVSDMEQVLSCLLDDWGRLDFVIDLDQQCALGRAALPYLLERGRGRIVHIRSSPGGLIHFNRTELEQLATRGVAINSIHVNGSAGGPVIAQDIAGTIHLLLRLGSGLNGQLIEFSASRHTARQRRPRSPTRRYQTCRGERFIRVA